MKPRKENLSLAINEFEKLLFLFSARVFFFFISPGQRRRRSSLAQLTDILREWSGGGSKRTQKPQLNRRETLADLARSLPWGRNNNESNQGTASFRKRRESSADSGITKSLKSRDSQASELVKMWRGYQTIDRADENIACVTEISSRLVRL